MFLIYILHAYQNLYKLNVIYYLIYKLTFLYIILKYKNLKFKYFIDDIVVNLWSFWNFARIGGLEANVIQQ